MVARSQSFSFSGIWNFHSKRQFVSSWVGFDCIDFNFLNKSSFALLSCLLCFIVLQAIPSFHFMNENFCFNLKNVQSK